MEELKVKKRLRDDLEESELEIDSPEVKRLRENLLNSFDDDAELCTMSPDLDSFMKGFEEEINASPAIAAGEADQVVDLSSDSGESRTDLGYLLEASDDELGLPPTASSPSGLESQKSTELVRVESDSSDLGNDFWEMPGYDSFGFEFENYRAIMERETQEEADRRREAALASAASLRPNFKPKSAITESQLSKFQELHRRRLQIKAKSKVHKRDKGGNGKDKSLKKAFEVPEYADQEPSKPAGDPTSNPIPESRVANISSGEDNVTRNMAPKTRQKLYWGLDTKERWERKSNM